MTRSVRRALSALTALVMTGTLFVGAPGPTYANGSDTYYVAQTGEPDGDGSSCTDPDFVGGDAAPIALAVDLATDGDTIYICAGTYLIEATIDLGAELLTLQGAGAGVTILDGGGDTKILTGTTVTVSGLTFQMGNGNVMEEGDSGLGGAIASENVTVTNSTFIGNEAHGGGAISGDTVTVTNSRFENNNTLTTSDGDGGGAILGEIVTVTNSTFIGNDSWVGGAIASENVTVTSSTFIGNEAYAGGAIIGDTVTVTNSTFVGNSAALGGAVGAASGTITRSRFRRNVASDRGGAIFMFSEAGSIVKLRGNVFTRNAAPFGGAITIGSCGATVSRKKVTLMKRTNRFVQNSATGQQGTKNIERFLEDCPT